MGGRRVLLQRAEHAELSDLRWLSLLRAALHASRPAGTITVEYTVNVHYIDAALDGWRSYAIPKKQLENVSRMS